MLNFRRQVSKIVLLSEYKYQGRKEGPLKLRMGGKNGKQSTHSKKGKAKESPNCTKPPLQEEDNGDAENVSSKEDLPVVEVEKVLSALHLDEETETKSVDGKNNNATPPIKSEDPTESGSGSGSGDTAKTEAAPKISSSPGLDRRKSLSNLEIHSPPSEQKDPTVVQDQDSVNYNNNIAEKMSQDQKEEEEEEEGPGTPKKLVPMKHPLEHCWTLW